jgi:cytochrome c5
MAINARLTTAEADAVIEFLLSGARTTGSSGVATQAAAEHASLTPLFRVGIRQPEPEDLYNAQCAPCHGVEGKGNGVAAIALNPKPRDFTASEFREQFSITELLIAISDGKGSMPAWGQVLSTDQIAVLVQYVRRFSRSTSSSLTDEAHTVWAQRLDWSR